MNTKRIKAYREKILNKVEKRKKAEEKANYTFRLNIMHMEKLKKICERTNQSQSGVIEEMILDFID